VDFVLTGDLDGDALASFFAGDLPLDCFISTSVGEDLRLALYLRAPSVVLA
jgi:hypothetical protein